MDPQKLREMLAGVWQKHKPEMEDRVGVLANTSRLLLERELTPEERTAAIYAAHKLAGALGTFGRQEGSELARAVEHRLEGETQLMTYAEELTTIVGQLRRSIASEP